MLAALGYLPNDPVARGATTTQLAFMHYWITKLEAERTEQLERILGTVWRRDELLASIKGTGSKGKTTECHVPLSLMVNPQSLTAIRAILGVAEPSRAPDGKTYDAMPDEEVERMRKVKQEQQERVFQGKDEVEFEAGDVPDEAAESLFDMSKEDFLAMIGRR